VDAYIFLPDYSAGNFTVGVLADSFGCFIYRYNNFKLAATIQLFAAISANIVLDCFGRMNTGISNVPQ